MTSTDGVFGTYNARAGHWGPRPAPMLASGRITYEVGGNIDAMSFGGIAAVHRMVTKLGLAEQIDEGLQLLKVHLPTTSPTMC